MQTFDFTQIGLKKPQEIIPMETGSCSLNYYVKNEDGEFLVKLKNTPKRKELLSNNLKDISGNAFCPTLLFEKQAWGYRVFVLKWIQGKNYFLEKLSSKTLKQIISAYLSFLTLINKNKTRELLPQKRPIEYYEKIQSPYSFLKTDLSAIQKDFSYQPTFQIIHGDFHFKNIIIKEGELQSFIDFENFRLGIPTEDLIRFLLTNAEQHRFFRTRYTVNLLKFFIQETPFSREDWLYGLDLFVLEKYAKRLRKKSVQQGIKLYYCNLLYRKLRSVINEAFGHKN
ncbi:MAG: aminoglycoside phosphotransferase family protein [Alphaproteobacteria bacterium]|nr:aminoglycoside phosphotransferase family protein [Alphaproteobacteria bacterium]